MDEWALAADDGGQQAFPIWPAREYASQCSSREWEGHEAEEISLEDLVGELLPKLERAGLRVAVFPTPGDRGVVVEPRRLLLDLEAETTKYE